MYAGLGSRKQQATRDDSGLNDGNWTVHFAAVDIGVFLPWFEVYRAVAEKVTPGSTLRVYIGDQEISYAPFGGTGGEWDPSQPALMQPGQDMYFCFDHPATGTPPQVTIWLRFQT